MNHTCARVSELRVVLGQESSQDGDETDGRAGKSENQRMSMRDLEVLSSIDPSQQQAQVQVIVSE